MNSRLLVTAALSLTALLVTGSSGSGQTAGPRPGTVVGRALDAQGKPIAGAKIWVKPVVTTGLYETRTDKNGRYEATGLPPVGYRVYAWHELEYNGERFCLRLGHKDPDDYNPINPAQGATRDFVLKASGRMEDVELYSDMGYFGGSVSVMGGPWGTTPARNAPLEFTLTPLGSLIDGSQGKAITRKPDAQGYLLDVPVGRYKVTAASLEGGARRPVRVGPDKDRLGSEAALAFKPSGQSCVGSYGGGTVGRAYLVWGEGSAAAPSSTPAAATPAPTPAPRPAAARGGAISGTVSAPAGGTVKGTVVIACLPAGDGCDEEKSGVARIGSSGASAGFKIEDLGSGEYTVLAWQDRNGNEEVDDADLVAVHAGRDGKALAVRPPAANLALKLTGEGASAGGSPAAGAGVESLAGAWDGTVTVSGGSTFNVRYEFTVTDGDPTDRSSLWKGDFLQCEGDGENCTKVGWVQGVRDGDKISFVSWITANDSSFATDGTFTGNTFAGTTNAVFEGKTATVRLARR